MKQILNIVVFVLLVAHCLAEFDTGFNWKLQVRQELSCEQSNSDCKKCLQQEPCTWCGENDERFSCMSRDVCPLRFQRSSCPERRLNVEEELEKLSEEKNPVHLDVPLVTLNASYLCHMKQNCSDCTGMGFCAWCEKKNKCVPYSGVLATSRVCGSDSWSRNQCINHEDIQQIKPCPQRSSSCRECLTDNHCFWCESTKLCGYYQGEGILPKNCSQDDWFYKKCSKVNAFVVLVPILLIIATPFIAYSVMYCIFYLMKGAGYEVLDDSDNSDDDEKKKKKPIMLRHDSFGGKTDQLRKKYNLGSKP